MDRIEHLIKIFESMVGDEELVRHKISNPDNRVYFIPGLKNINVINALHAIYIEKDYFKARHCFYLAARVDEYMSEKFDRRIIDSGTFPISYALLSDHEALIGRYAVLKNTINDTTNIGHQLANAVQNILLGRWDKLDINIRNMDRFVKFPKFKWWAANVEVFKGFRFADENIIKAGLQQMIITHHKRNTEQLIPRFFSIDTAGYCKLAWRLGYKIDLNNDLVPIELMPIEPLMKYDDYDFLQE